MKTQLPLIPILTVSFLSGGCMSSRYCNEATAYQTGHTDASSGAVSRPNRNRGQVCQEEYSPSSFQKDYDAGFLAGQRELCSDSNIAQKGRNDAGTFPPSLKSVKIFEVCPEPTAAEETYRQAFLNKACTDSVATRLGVDQAEKMKSPDFSTLSEVCTLRSHAGLEEVFQSAYQGEIRKKCTSPAAEARGVQDARKEYDVSKGLELLSVCPESQQESAVSAYRRGHNQTRSLMLQEEEVALQRRRLKQEQHFQQAQLQLERDRLRAPPTPLPPPPSDFYGRPSLGDSEERSDAGTHYFRHDSQRIGATCRVDSRQKTAEVEVRNHSLAPTTLTGRWRIEVQNERGRTLHRYLSQESLNIRTRNKKDFKVRLYGASQLKKARCKARFLGP